MAYARSLKLAALAACAVGATVFLGTASRADTLNFTNASAGNAVAEMSRKYGINIVFRSTIKANQPVSFSVDDPDTALGRTEAVNEVANALGLDYQKVYVVSKIDPGATVPDVKIDINGPIVFPKTKMPAQEAIQIVAAVDNAITQISGAVTGDVVFPKTRLSAAEAAAVIAKQTQTGWKAYYGMYKRGQQPSSLRGVMVDRTNPDHPVTFDLPLTFRNVDLTAALASDNSSDTTGQAGSAGNAYNYGNPYGYNPYSGGYVGADGSYIAPGSVYTPNQGAAPAVPGYNAPPGLLGPGVNVTTIPNTSATILPSFSYGGGYGGGYGGYGGGYGGYGGGYGDPTMYGGY